MPITAAIDLDTIAALVSFLLLLAPGTVWQVQQARHEPSVKESRRAEVAPRDRLPYRDTRPPPFCHCPGSGFR